MHLDQTNFTTTRNKQNTKLNNNKNININIVNNNNKMTTNKDSVRSKFKSRSILSGCIDDYLLDDSNYDFDDDDIESSSTDLIGGKKTNTKLHNVKCLS